MTHRKTQWTHRLAALLLALAVLAAMLPALGGTASAATDYWDSFAASDATDYADDDGGNVSIGTAAGLAHFASLVNAGDDFSGVTVTLTDAIDLSAHYWVPIGQTIVNATDINSTVSEMKFGGVFDGANHEITELTIYEPSGAYCTGNALFGSSNGTVKNVIIDVNINAMRLCAAIVAKNEGTVTDCTSTGIVKEDSSGGTRAGGGIVGQNFAGATSAPLRC